MQGIYDVTVNFCGFAPLFSKAKAILKEQQRIGIVIKDQPFSLTL